MVDIVEKNLKIGYAIHVKWLKMKYTIYAKVKIYETLRLKMFDSINDSDFVPDVDHKKTFITVNNNNYYYYSCIYIHTNAMDSQC